MAGDTRYRSTFASRYGTMEITVDATGTLRGISLPNKGPFDAQRRSDVPAAAAEAIATACRQLAEYFDGRRQTFDLPLEPAGTPFEVAVWNRLRSIPYGMTVSYGEIAHDLQLINGSRAVGRANGANPIPIVIPCHRVIGADGTLTGFGGGLPLKRALLELEGAIPPSLF